MEQQGDPAGRDAPREAADPARPTLERGTKVCVRNRFLGDWSNGFEVTDVLSEGYRIRRVSDGLSFPDVFPFEDVRLERRLHPERGVVGSYLDRQG